MSDRPVPGWRELRAIAGAGAPERLAIAHRLLLLGPALGDADAGEDAVAWVAQALTLVAGRDAPGVDGARARRASRTAAEVIVEEHAYFPTCSLVVRKRSPNLRWRCQRP
jgi:hypothetical protein